jgi:flagellar motor switch protein FliM
MHAAGAWLRTEIEVMLVSGEQMVYTEFVERIPDETYVCSIRLEPWGAIGLMELELSLALSIVDLLLGGTGTTAIARPLTDIEELILASVVQLFIKELNVAWEPVGLQFCFEKRESAAQVARMMPIGEKTLCVCFEIRLAQARGMLNLCLPAVVLNAILRKLSEDRDQPRRRSAEVRTRIRELLGESSFRTSLRFPPVRLKATEIAGLSEGMVLRLPVPRHNLAEFCVEGMSLSRAVPVRTGEHRGARLEPVEAMYRQPLAADEQGPARLVEGGSIPGVSQ